jgi:hypothetical protein
MLKDKLISLSPVSLHHRLPTRPWCSEEHRRELKGEMPTRERQIGAICDQQRRAVGLCLGICIYALPFFALQTP